MQHPYHLVHKSFVHIRFRHLSNRQNKAMQLNIRQIHRLLIGVSE